MARGRKVSPKVLEDGTRAEDARHRREGRPFDPARDGFGFRNPPGEMPLRAGAGPLARRLDSFMYGRGLCFGMAVAALASFTGIERRWTSPLAALPPTPGLLKELRAFHALQFYPRVALRVALEWARSYGGRPEEIPGRLRVAPESPDPHVICFGPRAARGFIKHLALAHAVAPYRLEEAGEKLRVYVYDPEYPKDRGRRVVFGRGSDGRFDRFRYGTFNSREGWGITLVPLSVALLPLRDACAPAPARPPSD